MLSQVARRSYNGQIGGEILPVRDHQDGREDQYRLDPGLILFRLVVSSLQLGVVGPYLACGQ
jgi:hypothetical protein